MWRETEVISLWVRVVLCVPAHSTCDGSLASGGSCFPAGCDQGVPSVDELHLGQPTLSQGMDHSVLCPEQVKPDLMEGGGGGLKCVRRKRVGLSG